MKRNRPTSAPSHGSPERAGKEVARAAQPPRSPERCPRCRGTGEGDWWTHGFYYPAVCNECLGAGVLALERKARAIDKLTDLRAAGRQKTED